MQNITKSLLVLLFISSCSVEVNEDQIVERNGIAYEVNSEQPFTGSVTSFYKNGQQEMKRMYKDGVLDGEVQFYFENGQLRIQAIYKDGMKDGEYQSYFENGQLSYTGRYLNGREIGIHMEYFSGGRTSKETEFNTESNLIKSVTYKNHPKYYIFSKEDVSSETNILTYNEFNPDGDIVQFHTSQNGKKFGPALELSRYGSKIEANYKNDELHGLYKQYWKDGMIQEIDNWEEGKLIGVSEKYDRKGRLVFKGTRTWNEESNSSVFNFQGDFMVRDFPRGSKGYGKGVKANCINGYPISATFYLFDELNPDKFLDSYKIKWEQDEKPFSFACLEGRIFDSFNWYLLNAENP